MQVIDVQTTKSWYDQNIFKSLMWNNWESIKASYFVTDLENYTDASILLATETLK